MVDYEQAERELRMQTAVGIVAFIIIVSTLIAHYV